MQNILIEAIKNKRAISFEYIKSGMAVGVRIANPHIIYITKNNHHFIDVYKTGGVKTDLSQRLPDWRCYDVKHIHNVAILDDDFEPQHDYKPRSPKYKNATVIAKI